MRRTDRQRDAAFAWEVFDRAPYAVLSVRDGEGGYGIPVSPARLGKNWTACASGRRPPSPRQKSLDRNGSASAIAPPWPVAG